MIFFAAFASVPRAFPCAVSAPFSSCTSSATAKSKKFLNRLPINSITAARLTFDRSACHKALNSLRRTLGSGSSASSFSPIHSLRRAFLKSLESNRSSFSLL